ncbi:GntR family transcriptional regulator [Sporanaerobium hydrogeniformans]|uniref:GntR family transcriptional regulator n=1 Tax=Sporanaerobium hydrogeniformans TaxID=3072179 RepID=A0AC61DD35_9FIRM|nr:GntR family transcriptional regulator [Sporanaerobium hydrogeniformans]PHV70872.1 GntR family transcriptional regulator [Sporanaerobium hydrogeniformans]
MFPIDVRDVRPIYEQIIDQIKEQVIKGILKPGDQLPSVRQLAGNLTVNANTVTKAYQELERQRIIETIRGRGTFIAVLPEKEVNKTKLEEIRKALKGNCIELHYMGFYKEQILEEVSKICEELIKED